MLIYSKHKSTAGKLSALQTGSAVDL